MKFNVIMCFIFDFQAMNRLGSQPLKKTKSKIWEFLINKSLVLIVVYFFLIKKDTLQSKRNYLFTQVFDFVFLRSWKYSNDNGN